MKTAKITSQNIGIGSYVINKHTRQKSMIVKIKKVKLLSKTSELAKLRPARWVGGWINVEQLKVDYIVVV